MLDWKNQSGVNQLRDPMLEDIKNGKGLPPLCAATRSSNGESGIVWSNEYAQRQMPPISKCSPYRDFGLWNGMNSYCCRYPMPCPSTAGKHELLIMGIALTGLPLNA